MRVMQIERYADRIEKVLAHLQTIAVDAQPGLEELASVAAISPFHFHRVWRVMTGETLRDSVRRVQMARASAALKDGAPMAEVAELAGYASGQSFARSLRAFAGVSASELRSDPEMMADFMARIERGVRTGDEEVRAMDVRIVDLDPLKVVALRNVGAYEDLFNGYGQLFEIISDWVGPEHVTGIHGIWPDDPGSVAPDAFRFDCAFAVAEEKDAPEGTRWEDAPAGPCLCVRHVGDYGRLLEVIDWLYVAAMEAGMELRDAPLFTHYLDDPEDTPEADLRTDVYLPIVVTRA